MHRFASFLILAGCWTQAKPPARTEPPPPAEQPQAAGWIAGRPFVARAALMFAVNRPGRNCSIGMLGPCNEPGGFTSAIRIFERPVSCAAGWPAAPMSLAHCSPQ